MLAQSRQRSIRFNIANSVPPALRPTAIQLLRMHRLWLDSIPFPKFRDNFINLSGIVSEEEFVHDVFTMPSFAISHDNAPWDPRTWIIEKPFAEKWGYLFY